MKFNFRTFVNSFFIYLVITVLALVALNFLGELVLATIANAIFGEKYGIKITKIFLSIVWFIVVFITIWIIKLKRSNSTEKRKKYLETHESNVYVGKDDVKDILRSSDYASECFSMLTLTVLCSVFFLNPMFLLPCIAFVPFNLWIYTKIHKKWILSCKTYE